MKLKQGVKLNGVRPELVLAIFIIEKIYTKHSTELVITSVTDSKHGKGSFHYLGLAVDLRTRDFKSNEIINTVKKEIKEALGDEFDVLHEYSEAAKVGHFHVEFQPK